MSRKYGKVIVDNKASELDRLFTYIIDEEHTDIIKKGMRVIVPFGRGNKIVNALLVDMDTEFHGDYKLKKIIDILDDKPIISSKLIDLGMWIKKSYLSSYRSAFQPILPPGDYKKVNSFVSLKFANPKHVSIEEKKIIDYLKDKDIVLLSDLKKETNIPYINKYLNSLEHSGIIETTIDIRTTITKKKIKWVKLKDFDIELDEIIDIIGNRAKKQIQIAQYLYNSGELEVNKVLKELKTSLSVLRALEDKGIVEIFDKEVDREPIKREIPKYHKHVLSSKQRKVFDQINYYADNKLNNRFLIHGVTGSGKTEIYLQLVEKMLEKNKDSIILVPEISLTPQTIDRFVGRFGDNVAILHSRLSQGERFDQWRMIKEGKVKIVIGARSAVFAPFSNLGLIIIDEEHESTYKSSQNPKYDTVEVASKRIDMDDGILVLGTATPSIETYNKALNRDIKLLELAERVNKKEMPEIQLVDMRDELNKGNRSMFSNSLYREIENTLKNKKQIILFLNRRGFSTFVSCRKCGYVAKCENCDISMTYYRHINKLRCHYCGITEEVPIVCPECKSKYIKHFGVGTEQVEKLTRETFPEVKVARMDRDTTTSKDSYEEILTDMKNKKIDILIGTQMIAKGLDFENVTLVGIIAADTTINLPDYRSPENSFQLITQVAGRAGRGKHKGKVVLQTYNPKHYSIVYAKAQAYKSFYNTEITLRKEFLYPPFIKLINILIYGEDQYKVGNLSKKVYNIIGRVIHGMYKDRYRDYIIGPYPAPLERIKNNYRYQILIKSQIEELDKIKDLVYKVCISNEYNLDMKDLKISIDINPISIL
ncbi:MAG TPA: primosomal protein N' [Tissierellaceae bacterium]|nr:primosomal protein N' [Tissierellaceae bacterium]